MIPTLRPEVKKGEARSWTGVHGRAKEGYNFPEVSQSIISATENLTHLKNRIEGTKSVPLLPLQLRVRTVI